MAIYSCNVGNTTGVQYIHFNTTGIYVGNANQQNIDFEHNSFTGLIGTQGSTADSETAIYFDGNLNSTITNMTIKYNSFGDANSCTNVFATTGDEGGYCAGIFNTQGITINATIEYNTFNHVEEGVHFHQICSNCGTGTNVSITQNLQIKYNYFTAWHRIAAEIQTSTQVTGQQIAHNVLINPINPSYGTMFLSMACCTGGRTYLNSAPANPSNVDNDNVMLADSSHIQTITGKQTFYCPVIGIEYWGGYNSTANYNVAGGVWSNMITWDFGSGTWYINNNNLCAAKNGTYITAENTPGATNSPVISNNTTNATCSTVTTTAPTISQTSSAVTITDAGQSGVVPDGQPISIFYTTDGSNPTVNSTLYQSSFTPSAGAVVKAIAMWGVAPWQPMTQLPSANMGYVPSGVVSLTYTGTGGSGTPTLTSLSVSLNGTTVQGGTAAQQLTTTGNYSDGSTAPVTGASFSTTSASSICTVSATGLFTPVNTGSCSVAAAKGSVTGGAVITISAAATKTLVSKGINTIPTSNVNMLVVPNTQQMQEYGNYSDGTSAPITASSWAVINSTTGCTVSGSGLVTATAASAKCSIQADGSSSSWDFSITATKTLTNVTVTGPTATLTIGGMETVSSTAIYSDGSTAAIVATFASSNNSVCNVNANTGLVTGVAPGSCNISATAGGVTSANPLAIVVSAAAATLTGISIGPTSVVTNAAFPLTVTGLFSDNSNSPIDPTTVTWISSNTSVISINAAGLASVVGIGTSNVSATTGTFPNVLTSNVVAIAATTGVSAQYNNSSPSVPYSWAQTCPVTQNLTWNTTYRLAVGNDGSETITTIQ